MAEHLLKLIALQGVTNGAQAHHLPSFGVPARGL